MHPIPPVVQVEIAALHYLSVTNDKGSREQLIEVHFFKKASHPHFNYSDPY